MSQLGWGILATGSIARQFAGGLRISETSELVAVGSRSIETAEKFTSEFGGKPYASYEEVLADPKVEAVYIATPHHLHSEWTIKAAKAGKAILCEKPFTLTLAEAKRTLKAVEEAGVFFMEAFMYRCHPQTQKIKELLASGVVGEPQVIDAEFGFNASHDWTNFRGVNALGGGGLMDVGCYPVSFARMVFGSEPTRCDYSARIGSKGYDEVGVGILTFEGGRFLHFGTAVHLAMRNSAEIHCSEGRILVDDPWKVRPGAKIHLFKPYSHEAFETIDLSGSNDELYMHEADTVARNVGAKQAGAMTPADTIGNMGTLDALRKSAGLVFEGQESR